MNAGDIISEEDKSARIKEVLSYYDRDFTKYLATIIGFGEAILEEMNNQIRNAMTHLARAQDVTSAMEFNKQIERSRSHIDRANRDCLKASIVVLREKLDCLAVDAKFYHVALTPDIEGRISKIENDRKAAYVAEAQGQPDTIKRMEDVLADIIFTSDEIKKNYPEAGTRRARFFRFLRRWRNPFFSIVALVVGMLIRPYVQPLIDFLKSLARQHGFPV